MSIPVDLVGLADVLTRYRFAYLMTSNPEGAPHAVAVAAVLEDGDLVVNDTGRRTRENAQRQPAVGLVWPPQSMADHSLIVDGEAKVIGGSLRIRPTRAVLHRPAPSPEPDKAGTCGSDCIELGPAS